MSPQTKTCSVCGVTKPLTEFYLHGSKSNPGRRRPDCKTCRKAVVAVYQAAHQEQHRASARKHRLAKHYGLTPEQYDELLAAQGGRCAICKTENPGTQSGVFPVDHNHSCCPGQVTCGRCVRGLLCTRCNNTLGWVEANLSAAWLYLHVPHSGWRSLSIDLRKVEESVQ